MNKTLATGYLLITGGTLLGLTAPQIDGRTLVALLALSLGAGMVTRVLSER